MSPVGVLTWRQAERSRAFRTSFTFSGKKRTPPKAPIWGYGLGVPKETSTILKIGKNWITIDFKEEYSDMWTMFSIYICFENMIIKFQTSSLSSDSSCESWVLWVVLWPRMDHGFPETAWNQPEVCVSTVWCPCKWCKVFWYRYKQSIQPVSSSFFFPLTQIFWGWMSPSFLFVGAFQSLQLSPNGIGSTGSSNRGK